MEDRKRDRKRKTYRTGGLTAQGKEKSSKGGKRQDKVKWRATENYRDFSF